MLRVAVPAHSFAADVDKLKLALAKAEGDIDVLLTNEWPQVSCCPQGAAGTVACCSGCSLP